MSSNLNDKIPPLTNKDKIAELKAELLRLQEQEYKDLIEYEKLLEEEEYENAEKSLYAFFKSSWEYVDSQRFVDSWHIECICEHAQAAITRTEPSLRRLLVTIPPRHCLAEDTLVQRADGSLVEIKDIKIGDSITSSNGRELGIDEVVDKVYTGQQKVYRIHLSDGSYIDATENHRLHSWDRWRYVRDLKVGMPLTVMQDSERVVENPSALSEDDAFLLVMSMLKPRASLSTKHAILDRFFSICSARSWDTDLLLIKLWAEQLYDGHPLDVELPPELMSASLNVVKEFIGTYIALFGHIQRQAEQIVCKTETKRLGLYLQILLKRLGIKSSIVNKKDKKFYLLVISGRNQLQYIRDNINIYQWKERLEAIDLSNAYGQYEIPGRAKFSLKHEPKWFWRHHKTHLATIKGNKWYHKESFMKLVELDGNIHLANKVNSGLGWREIKKIEELEPINTYDIETKKYHAFFANGILSHNSKSKILSVAAPSWTWGPANRPYEKFITASYSERLFVQNVVESRNLLNHPWYQKRWIGKGEGQFQLASDSNTRTRIDTDKFGYRIATSPGGSGMGFGYSVCIIDDPLDGTKASSDLERKKVINWYTGTIKNRANDPTTDVIIVVAQRLDEEDLPGYLIENEDFFHLNIPEEFEKSYTFMSPIGFNDPRTREGQLICPDRFDEDFIEDQKKNPFDYAAKYQQRPAPLSGGLIKREWIKYYDSAPSTFDIVVLSFDLSMVDTDKADYTVGTVWGKKGADLYMLDIVRERMNVLDQINSIILLSNKYPLARAKLIEAKANGPAVIKMLEKQLSGMIAIEPKDFGGNKQGRLNACVPEFSAGNVHFPRGHSLMGEIEKELLTFPKSKNDDIVDSITQAINWLSLNHRTTISPVVRGKEQYNRGSVYDLLEKQPNSRKYIKTIWH